MKLLTFSKNNKEAIGVLSLEGDMVYPIEHFGFKYSTMNDLIDAGLDEIEKLKKCVGSGCSAAIPIKDVVIEAPIPCPKQDIICLGINYMEHAVESVRYKKEAFDGDRKDPVYFSKRVNRAVRDGEKIPSHKDIIETLDYEVELAVIIGKDAKNVEKKDAFDYVLGYTVINDVTARELQTRHKQWYFGKSLDKSTPMGPYITTVDEVGIPPVLKIMSWVNGELRQNSTTDLLIHDIPYIIHELSKGVTLKKGTIIATGTPAGVGMGFVPPKFLAPKDVIKCEIEGLGSITNEVE